MSDLHGQWDKYQKMLETIRFSEDDVLYVLGDFVDRGENGIRILLDVMSRPNVVSLVGNHDWTMASLIGYRSRLLEQIGPEGVQDLFDLWFSDGGLFTYMEFRALDPETKRDVLTFVNEMHYIYEVEVNGRKFFLSHTLPAYDGKPLKEHPADDFLHGMPDYGVAYDGDVIFVTGHTPTEIIDPDYEGRIWQGNNHVAIDCGAGFGGKLGCLRLDDMREFYV